MITEAITRLDHLCNILPALLSKIAEADLSEAAATGKWTKKQILGHLVDSATNNHHRFVRAQFEEIPEITYNQDKWNEANCYGEIPAAQLISFWTAYNKQLVELMKVLPDKALQKQCNTGGGPLTLEWLFSDYVVHLEHHLKQLVHYTDLRE